MQDFTLCLLEAEFFKIYCVSIMCDFMKLECNGCGEGFIAL